MTTTVQQEYRTPSQMAHTGNAQPEVVVAPLLGTWVNVNKATRDLVKVVVTGSGAAISVNPFGACSPTPCNWGVVAGVAYAASVSSGPAVAFSAAFKFSFSQVIVVGHLQGSELLVETFTHFTDGSGRSDYYSTDLMAK